MMIGTCIQGGALVAMGGLGSVANPSREYKIGITAMTVVLNAAYCFGWAPLSHVITAEIPTTRLRDITYATGSVVNIAVAFSITFSLPYLLYAPYAALGPKVGFIFGSFALLAIFFAWFCIPETGVSDLLAAVAPSTTDHMLTLLSLTRDLHLRSSTTCSCKTYLFVSSAVTSTAKSCLPRLRRPAPRSLKCRSTKWLDGLACHKRQAANGGFGGLS